MEPFVQRSATYCLPTYLHATVSKTNFHSLQWNHSCSAVQLTVYQRIYTQQLAKLNDKTGRPVASEGQGAMPPPQS